MTLDATKPTDSELISDYAAYLRETRAEVNGIAGSGNVGVTDLAIAAGSVALAIPTDLGLFGYEIVNVTAAGAVNIATITGGTDGQVKVFVFGDNLVGIVDGIASGGKIYLNQLPALSTFAAQIRDVLALVNVGGDGGATTHGYWKELYRTIALK